jgi:hypothetical protein
VPDGQTLSQAPQWFALAVMFVQVPVLAHQSSPNVGHTQLPEEQTCPSLQEFPQLPQLSASVDRFTHAAS